MSSLKYCAPYFLAIFIVVALSLYKGPDTNWDLYMYHLYSGWMISDLRFFKDMAAVDMQTFYPPYLNYIVYKLWVQGFPLYNVLLGAIQSISIVFCLKIIDIDGLLTSNKSPLKYIYFTPSIFIILLNPLYLSEIGTSFQSSLTAPLVLAAVFYSLPFKSKSIFLASFFIFSASFLKYTNGIFLMSWMLTLPIIARDLKSFKSLICGAALSLLIFLPWHLLLFFNFDNPVFPLANKIFESEFYPLKSFRDQRFIFSNIPDFFKWFVQINEGSAKTLEFKYKTFAYSIFIIFYIINIIKEKNISSITAYIGLNIIFSFILWAIFFSYSRYYIAGDFLIAVFIIRVIMVNYIESTTRITLIFLVFLMYSIQSINYPDWSNDRFTEQSKLLDDDKKPINFLVIGLQLSKILVELNSKSNIVRIGGDLQALTERGIKNFNPDNSYGVIFERRYLTDAINLTSELYPSLSVDYCNKYPNHKNLDEGEDFQMNSVAMICHLEHKKITSSYYFDLRNGFVNNKYVMDLVGFSGAEESGRWTVGDFSSILFSGCLMPGKYRVRINYYPHITDSFSLFLMGKQIGILKNSSSSMLTYENDVWLEGGCYPRVDFKSEFLPRSPYELKIGDDRRNLGLRIVDLTIK